MLGFTSVSPSWIDVSARQGQIGRALRSQFEALVAQAVPEHMLELLRQADLRLMTATGREVQFADNSTRFYSINFAIALVGLVIVSWALYDVALMIISQPKTMAATAFVGGLMATFAAAAWLVEDNDF